MHGHPSYNSGRPGPGYPHPNGHALGQKRPSPSNAGESEKDDMDEDDDLAGGRARSGSQLGQAGTPGREDDSFTVSLRSTLAFLSLPSSHSEAYDLNFG
jgi:hypothetical protein